jgi:hypothetical protein
VSASKSNYPERLPFPRPKKPMKGKGRPSSSKVRKKSKVWLSSNNIFNDKIDVSPPTSQPWWKCPMMKAERLRKWRS